MGTLHLGWSVTAGRWRVETAEGRQWGLYWLPRASPWQKKVKQMRKYGQEGAERTLSDTASGTVWS
jgi:hypothetical protein